MLAENLLSQYTFNSQWRLASSKMDVQVFTEFEPKSGLPVCYKSLGFVEGLAYDIYLQVWGKQWWAVDLAPHKPDSKEILEASSHFVRIRTRYTPPLGIL